MEKRELENMCNYFLDLEKELADSSRYIEPEGQEKTYSFEFRKLIILSCTEFESACKALCELLKASGTEADKVIKTTVFIKNMDDFAKVNEVYSKYFTQNCPARSCVEVARLPKDVLIEIEAIAEK